MAVPHSEAPRLPGTALIAASSVLFAAMAVLARTLAGAMSAGQLVVIRFAFGLVAVGALFAVRRKGPRMPRLGLLALRGLLGGSAVYFYFLAIETVGVGPATLLNYTAPAYAAVFAVLFLRERVSAHLIGALVLATAGAMVVAASTLGEHPFTLAGGAWAGLLSALLAGAAMVSVRGLRHDTDAPTVFLSFCVFGGLVGLPFAAARWVPLTWALLWPALGVGLLSFVAQLLYTHAFAYVTASVGSAVTQLTPVVSWALAVLLLDEPARPLTLLGAVVCLAGVLWGALAGRRH